jgi:hypothetical protein
MIRHSIKWLDGVTIRSRKIFPENVDVEFIFDQG